MLICGNKREAKFDLPVKLFFFFQINSNRTYSQCVQKRSILWLLKRVTVCSWVTKTHSAPVLTWPMVSELNHPDIRDSHRVSMALSRILFCYFLCFLVVICLLLVNHFRFLWWIEVKNPGILTLFEWENMHFTRRRFLHGLFKY